MAILNEEQEMLRDMAREWATNESPIGAFRKVRNASAQVIIQFSETMTGIEAVQAYYREPRNQEIFT